MVEKISEYEHECVISAPLNPTEFKNVVTPSFTPLTDTSLTFHFEAWHQIVPYGNASLYLFKLKLVKQFSAYISPTLEVILDVKVYYSDGSLFVEYTNMPATNIERMQDINFVDAIREMYVKTFDGVNSSKHHRQMQCNTLKIKCKMTFYDLNQISFSKAKMKPSNKYSELIRNLKSVYEPNVLSDFVFKIGDKSFPAHKVILAAHSPVFKNMLTQESKTNSVTITNATPEIFDLFLKCLYSGEIEDKSWDSIKELYYLADEYNVGILKNLCAEFSISLLSVDLVCSILEVAYKYSDSSLKTAAKFFAIQHLKELVLRDDWKELATTHPMIGYEVTLEFFHGKIK